MIRGGRDPSGEMVESGRNVGMDSVTHQQVGGCHTDVHRRVIEELVEIGEVGGDIGMLVDGETA